LDTQSCSNNSLIRIVTQSIHLIRIVTQRLHKIWLFSRGLCCLRKSWCVHSKRMILAGGKWAKGSIWHDSIHRGVIIISSSKWLFVSFSHEGHGSSNWEDDCLIRSWPEGKCLYVELSYCLYLFTKSILRFGFSSLSSCNRSTLLSFNILLIWAKSWKSQRWVDFSKPDYFMAIWM
jgi:hypothetical protein